MKQLKYNIDDNVVLFDVPQDWDITNIDAITLQINDVNGNTLQAATSVGTLYYDTLSVAASSGDNSIVLTNDDAITPGYYIRIKDDNGVPEDRKVIKYTSSTKTVLLETVLDYDHPVDAGVYPVTVAATVDTTDTDVYTKGRQLLLIWSNEEVGAPYTELAEIAKTSEFSPSEFERQFSALYPREYESASGERLGEIRKLAERRLEYRLKSRGMNMDRVKDQPVIMDTLLALTRYLTIDGNGDDWEFEINHAWDVYLREFENLCSLPIWVDDNQDDIQTEEEYQVFEPLIFGRNM